MEHYAGIDVSVESACVCIVDPSGRIVREAKVASEPDALIAWFGGLGFPLTRIGLEAGPLSQWLFAAMAEAGLAVELLETRHVRAAFKAMHDIEMSLRGILRGFGLKVGKTTRRLFDRRVRELIDGRPTLMVIAEALLADNRAFVDWPMLPEGPAAEIPYAKLFRPGLPRSALRLRRSSRGSSCRGVQPRSLLCASPSVA